MGVDVKHLLTGIPIRIDDQPISAFRNTQFRCCLACRQQNLARYGLVVLRDIIHVADV